MEQESTKTNPFVNIDMTRRLLKGDIKLNQFTFNANAGRDEADNYIAMIRAKRIGLESKVEVQQEVVDIKIPEIIPTPEVKDVQVAIEEEKTFAAAMEVYPLGEFDCHEKIMVFILLCINTMQCFLYTNTERISGLSYKVRVTVASILGESFKNVSSEINKIRGKWKVNTITDESMKWIFNNFTGKNTFIFKNTLFRKKFPDATIICSGRDPGDLSSKLEIAEDFLKNRHTNIGHVVNYPDTTVEDVWNKGEMLNARKVLKEKYEILLKRAFEVKRLCGCKNKEEADKIEDIRSIIHKLPRTHNNIYLAYVNAEVEFIRYMTSYIQSASNFGIWSPTIDYDQ